MNLTHSKKIVLLAVLFIFALSTAAFADSITIKASASPKKGGTISPPGKVTVESGENQQFTITPNTGYQIKDVIVDKVSQGVIDIYTFTDITQKHSIKAKFIKKTFSVTIAQGGKVSVSPRGKMTVQYGKIVNLKIKPESEDVVPILLVNGKQIDITKKGKVYTYALTPTGDTSIYATSAVEAKLSPSTKIMDGDTAQKLSSISPDGSALIFTGTTPFLDSLQPDDVIMCGVTETTPYGLLRKVTNVTIATNQVTIGTTQASLGDAIEEGEIISNQALTAHDIASFVPLRDGVSLQEAIPGPVKPQACLNFNNVFYDFDGNEETTNDQIVLHGSACLDPAFRFAAGLGWCSGAWNIPYPCVENLVFSVGLTESTEVELSANYSYSFSEKIPVAEIVFGAITAGPVVLVPVLTVYVGVEGSLSAGISTSVSQSAGFEIGLSYSDGDWSRISNLTLPVFTYNLPAFTELEAQAKAYLEPQFDLLIYGVAGPYARIQGYLELDLKPLEDPWLLLWAGIEAAAGVKVGILGYDFEYEFPLILEYKELLKYISGNQPPTITSLTANPSLVTAGGTSTITLVASDPEHDPLTCTWTNDKGTLSSTTGCDPVIWTAPATSGSGSVLVSVTDNKGRHAPVSKSVVINMCSSFNIDPTSASFDENITIGARVNVTAPSGCSWTSTSNNTWITITGGSSGAGNGTVEYTLKSNIGSFRRIGTITIGAIIFTVTQEGSAIPICSYGLSSYSASYDASGGNGSVNVTTQAGCGWSAKSNAPWITITGGASGNGNGTVSYLVAANTGSERTGTITVSNKTFTVTQEELPRPPGPPTGVSASDGTYTDKVRITWKAPTTGGTKGYRIYRATANNAGSATEIGMSTGTWQDDTSAVAGTTYWYWVKAYNAAGSGPFSNGDSGYKQAALQVPGPSSALSASDGTYTDKVRLAWTAPTTGGAPTGYRIYRYTSNSSGSAAEISTSTATSYDDTSAVAGTTYWYWVKAYNAAGSGPFSNGDSGYKQAALQVPGQSTNLSASDGAYTDKVRLAWTAPTTGGAPTGYRIYRYTSNSSGSATEISTSTATSYDDTSAVAGTTYWYWVKPYNAAGSGPFSNGDSGYKQAALQVPGPISGLWATKGAYTDRVRLTWAAPTTGGTPTGYRIYRAIANDPYSASELGTSTTTSFDDYSVVSGTTYWYWVKAYNKAGDGRTFSDFASGFALATPGAPINLDASDGTYTDKIRITWGKPTLGGIAEGYRLYRNTVDSSESAKEIFKTKETWYDDKVGDAKIYYYYVKAFNSAGSGPFSKVNSGHRQGVTLSVILDSINHGWGTVTGLGIKCGYGGVDCSETYLYGTSVTLTQTSFDINNWLTKWSGCDSTDYVTCTVIMNNSRTVRAEFELYSPP